VETVGNPYINVPAEVPVVNKHNLQESFLKMSSFKIRVSV